MNIQALSNLLAAIVVMAIGASVVLRDRRRRTYTSFGMLTAAVGLYDLLRFLSEASAHPVFDWAQFIPAAFIPPTSVRFFRALMAEPVIGGRNRRPSVTYVWTGLWLIVIAYAGFNPIHESPWFRVPFGVYVFAGLYRCVLELYWQYRATINRAEKARIRYLTIGSFAATTMSVVDFLPFAAVSSLSIGHFLVILYLYFLSQTLFRYRLLDLNELVGRIAVLATLVTILSVTYGLLLSWVAGGEQQGLFILNTIVASFVILVLVEPVRNFLETAIPRWLMRDRHDLRLRIDVLRRELTNVIDVREMVGRILDSLDSSRRVTHAAVYIVDADGAGYDLLGNLGPRPTERLDIAVRRPFFDRLREGSIQLEGLAAELLRLETGRGGAPEKELELLDSIARSLDETRANLAIPILGSSDDDGEQPVLGVICLKDERLRNAFGSDDLDSFYLLAGQAAITIENSRLYERVKERDRLAALGEMAAGLAHEIRNPLGAIKGAAQLLTDKQGQPVDVDEAEDFIAIIVDEVNRLNRVVSQFLDYARPYKGDADELEMNDLVGRTVKLIRSQGDAAARSIAIELDLADNVPVVRGDAGQLQQVFLNLGLNAIQAMDEAGGTLTVTTSRRIGWKGGIIGTYVAIRFQDTGPGISSAHMKNLFIPFFTTKDGGTGLGLSISQRIVSQHGGRIEVRSQEGQGSAFTVLLPIADDSAMRETTGSFTRGETSSRATA